MKTPVNLITGFLGVGKTTALLHLLAQRPAGSRWAVLVNEFGQVGIDGATLTQNGVALREVPGGCICCSAQLPLRVALTKLIREVRPERLLIEPTGLGHPAGVIDVLRGEGLASALELRNAICLVDPRQLSDGQYRGLETYQDQIALADVLVANKGDLATPLQLQAFTEIAAQLYPPKRLVAQVSQGRLDAAWLDIESTASASLSAAQAHDTQQFTARGWVFSPEQVFDPGKLKALFEAWGNDAQIVRAKGVFRIGRDWRLLNLAGGKVDMAPIAYRRDSRLDVIARAEAGLDWGAVKAELNAAMTQPNVLG
ncbi:MAG: GTP-binding protein [Hydrogenophilales bacterium]|nr:GTP-binding protein [Hydrogenophilales bacterium]